MNKKSTLTYQKAAYCLAGMMFTLPVFAQDATEELDDDILLLSPFEVEASSNVGYLATQTLAGTRIKTDLKDVGSAISVVTKEMLRDTGATDNQTLLTYTTATEVGGTSGNYSGSGDFSKFSEDNSLLRPNQNTRVRGLTSADNTRNFFLTEAPWDGYNVERIDMQRGPNSILFGLGSPAGIINASTNQANFNGDHGNVEIKFDKEGSRRVSLDYNQVILEDELAVRVDALYDDTRFKQKPAFEEDQRIYAAVRYAPKWLQSDNVTTTIKANFEHGEIDANRPRMLPPNDLVTPWFTQLDQNGYHPINDNASPTNGPAGRQVATNNPNYDGGKRNPNYAPAAAGAYADCYNGPVWIFDSPDSATASMIYQFNMLSQQTNSQRYPTLRDAQIVAYSNYANNAMLKGGNDGLYRDKVLQDPGFFDFYHKLLDGDSKSESQNFESYNVSFTQSFFENRLSYDVTYDNLEYDDMAESILNGWSAALTIDIRSHLANGAVNPNLGRPYVFNRLSSNGNSHDIERENFRFTATAELRFSDFLEKGSTIERILGRHDFTGLYSTSKRNEEHRGWKLASISDQAWGTFVGNGEISHAWNDTTTAIYLGGPITGNMSDQHLDGLSGRILPASGPVNYYLDQNTAGADGVMPWLSKDVNVITADKKRDELTTIADLAKDEITSKAFVWQAYLFDGLVVPTFGYREDKSDTWLFNATANPQSLNPNKSVNFGSEYYTLPNDPSLQTEGNSKSWSIVVHSPEFINQYLPWETKLSVFYNSSENFKPEARVDILNDPIDPSYGDTTDYGFVISMFKDRVSFKVNWFETTVSNATVPGNLDLWHAGGVEVWGAKYASLVKYGQAAGASSNLWDWGTNTTHPVTKDSFASQDEARAFGQRVSQLFLDNFTSDKFLAAWSIRPDILDYFKSVSDHDDWNYGNIAPPQRMAATSDMKSEGVEFELFLQPTDNWSISINAAKVEASRYNLADSIKNYIIERNYVINQTDAGLVRLWGANVNETLRDRWNTTIFSTYKEFTTKENTNNAEVRPWRFNLITNYNFTEGFLSGFNIGGGIRWQDKNVVGYHMMPDTESGGFMSDPDNPYYGPTETAVDMWMGYQMALTDKIDWRIQFNIRNMFGKNELVPITVEPDDGSWATARIAEPMAWSITNTFSF